MVLGCLLFRLFRSRLCSFRSLHSRSLTRCFSARLCLPLLALLAFAFPRSLLFPLTSLLFPTPLCLSDTCFSMLAF